MEPWVPVAALKVVEDLNFFYYFLFFFLNVGIPEAAVSCTDLALACSLSAAFCVRGWGGAGKKNHQTSQKSNINF